MTRQTGTVATIERLTVALSIAGSDSGGGAGIQADLKTFFALGVHGTSVITAITAQNTLGVTGWQAVSQQMLLQQLDAVLDDLPPAAIKTGMLADAKFVVSIGKRLKNRGIPLVIDPVLVASSGDTLAGPGSIEAYIEHLLPMALLVTPNYPEAEALTGIRVRNTDDARQAARSLLGSGCQAVLIKGGHGEDDAVEDLLVSEEGEEVYRHPRLTGVFHGTGCTLSAAITAHIALGKPLDQAVSNSIQLLCRCMEAAVKAGSGSLKVLKIPAEA